MPLDVTTFLFYLIFTVVCLALVFFRAVLEVARTMLHSIIIELNLSLRRILQHPHSVQYITQMHSAASSLSSIRHSDAFTLRIQEETLKLWHPITGYKIT